MLVYFNNCNNRDHPRMYGPGAFYDLNRTGFQAMKARNLRVGQKCIVASIDPDGQIAFSWYAYSREIEKPDDTGTLCRVFFGDFIKSEAYSKTIAARTSPYSSFFDKNGNFKRQSVIEY